MIEFKKVFLFNVKFKINYFMKINNKYKLNFTLINIFIQYQYKSQISNILKF